MAAILLVVASDAHAVIFTPGDGTGNTTPPPDDPGFVHVGARAGASAVYLGDGWVLTANHVGAGATTIDGISYNFVPGSAVLLNNPTGSGQSTFTDLLMYRIEGDPGLPRLTISANQLAVGAEVDMIGRGFNRDPTLTNWNSSWVEVPSSSTFAGYKWVAGQVIRWGNNTVFDNEEVVNIGSQASPVHVNAFTTRFDKFGTTFDAQAAVGDSGGGVFHKDQSTGEWELAGVMLAVSTFNNQPALTSVFNNVTYIADLSVYREQILTLNPLPGDVNLDFVVDIFDVNLISEHWGEAGPLGDANHDGIVDIFDVNLVSDNWTTTVAAASGSGVSAVPEPATWIVASIGTCLAWLAKRRHWV